MRKRSDSVTLRNEYVLKRIKDIKAEHPFWGYRKVWAYLRYVDGLWNPDMKIVKVPPENWFD